MLPGEFLLMLKRYRQDRVKAPTILKHVGKDDYVV